MAGGEKLNVRFPEKIGQIPRTRYFRLGNASGEFDQVIGIEAHSSDGSWNRFFLIHNFKFGDLRDESGREAASSFVARVKLQTGIDVALGLPVLPATSQHGRKVATFQDNNFWGVYAKIAPSEIRNLIATMGGIVSEEHFLRNRREEFVRLSSRVRLFLPSPEASRKS